MEQYGAEYRVLGLQKMHVAGGDCHLSYLVAYFHYAPIESAEILLRIMRILHIEHEHIIIEGLYLKVIVPFSDALLLLLGQAAAYGAVKLARFTSGAQKYAFTKHIKKASWYAGTLEEILQMRIGYELIKVFEAL